MISFQKPNIEACLSPRQVLIGDEAANRIGEVLSNWQVAEGRVLIVADNEVVRLGLVERIQGFLAGSYELDLFDDIIGEPTLSTAENLAGFARRKSYSAVVGVGGGSAMDMSKLGAALAVNPGDVTDYLGITRFEKPPLPLVAVPTTAGTGAEATAISMLSVKDKKAIVLSPQLVPLTAVLDPLMTETLPPRVTAATGLDALSHALEAFMSTKANPYTDTQAIATITIVGRWLKKAFENGSDMEARRAMIYAAFTGGLCLNAGVVLGHSVAYTIANRAHIPHGVSCAMALPYTMAYNLQALSERLTIAAGHVLETADATGEGLTIWVDDLVSALGMPRSLQDVGLKESDLGPMAEECINKYPRPTNPTPITKERLEIFYKMMFNGDVRGCIKAFGSE
jgi:alcohol dehydrogenase class IV